MVKLIRPLLFALVLLVAPALATAQAPPPPAASLPDIPPVAAPESPDAARKRLLALLDSLHPEKGTIRVAAAHAVLTLGDNYYFLPAEEARRVLTEGWGNPADSVSDVLGMVFPAGKTFLDDTWGGVVTFEESGFVDDADAKEIDYEELLANMKKASVERNNELLQRGLPTQTLVGWAQPPTYDAQRKSLIWARDIRFSSNDADTLNYDVRLLGRHGVLSLNMVAGMKDLATVRTAAASFGQAAAFETGERYADYDSSTDKKAEYGLAGLVAAGAGAAAAKKLGLLAILAGFGKKLFILIAIGFSAVVGFFRRMFGRKDEEA